MTPDSVHLLTRSSQMSLFRDGKGRVRRAYYGARLHEPEDAFSDSASAPLLCTTLADSWTACRMRPGSTISALPRRTVPSPCAWNASGRRLYGWTRTGRKPSFI